MKTSNLRPVVYFILSAEKVYIAGRFFFEIVVKVRIPLIYAGFEDLTALVMKNFVFWDVMLCSVPSSWVYNWAILFLGDINTRIWPPDWRILESETVKCGRKSRWTRA
jgi:hypothetical protein